MSTQNKLSVSMVGYESEPDTADEDFGRESVDEHEGQERDNWEETSNSFGSGQPVEASNEISFAGLVSQRHDEVPNQDVPASGLDGPDKEDPSMITAYDPSREGEPSDIHTIGASGVEHPARGRMDELDELATEEQSIGSDAVPINVSDTTPEPRTRSPSDVQRLLENLHLPLRDAADNRNVVPESPFGTTLGERNPSSDSPGLGLSRDLPARDLDRGDVARPSIEITDSRSGHNALPPSNDPFESPGSNALPGPTLSGVSSERDSGVSRTFSELAVGRQSSSVGVGASSDSLRSPAGLSNSTVGGDFDLFSGSFSFSRPRGPTLSRRPSGDTESLRAPSSEDYSPRSPISPRHQPWPDPNSPRSSIFPNLDESDRSRMRHLEDDTTAINQTRSGGMDRLEEMIDRLRVANLGLHQTISEQKIKLQQLETQSSLAPRLEAERLEARHRATLQQFHIIPSDDAQPRWKLDQDGTRIGALYNDIPNIYRESAVEILLGRAALRLMLADFDTMVSIAIKALLTAERLNYAPLTARCHFVHGVALYHNHRFEDAVQEFQLSYECSEQYEIPEDLIEEWCNGSTDAIGSSPALSSPQWDDSSIDSPTKKAAGNYPRLMAKNPDLGDFPSARKIWRSPAATGNLS